MYSESTVTSLPSRLLLSRYPIHHDVILLCLTVCGLPSQNDRVNLARPYSDSTLTVLNKPRSEVTDLRNRHTHVSLDGSAAAATTTSAQVARAPAGKRVSTIVRLTSRGEYDLTAGDVTRRNADRNQGDGACLTPLVLSPFEGPCQVLRKTSSLPQPIKA